MGLALVSSLLISTRARSALFALQGKKEMMDAATLWNTPDLPPSLQDSADDAGQLGNPLLLHFSKTKGAIHIRLAQFFARPSPLLFTY